MVVLLIGMAITAIWMSAALPAWRQQVQRQREEDLIFRGEQYARAIMLFQDKNNGANPPNIDILVSQHYLRKKWKDPITNDDFLPFGPGVAVPGSAAPGQGAPGQAPGRGSQPAQGGQAGITGVRSKSQAASIKIYENQQQYNLWPFDAAIRRARTGRPAPVAPGQNPRGGGPRQGGPPGRGGDQQIVRPPGAPGGGGPGRAGPPGGRSGPPSPAPVTGRGRGGDN